MPSKQDWSPRKVKDPLVLLASGDEDPFIVYQVYDEKIRAYRTLGEHWQKISGDWEDGTVQFHCYRFEVEDNVAKDLDWVEWERIASMIGRDLESLMADAKSPDPLTRAWLYDAVGSYYGWENIDAYPEMESQAFLAKRWRWYPSGD
jgi:hypothetical protein